MLLKRPAAIAGAVGTLAAFAGCGGDSSSAGPVAEEPRTVTVTRTVDEPAPREKTRRASAFRSCDSNIRARIGTTTCEFAQNVFYELWNSGVGHPETAYIIAYSPVTGQDYDMTCPLNTNMVVCRGADGSAVKIRSLALDAYSAEQARAYECAHQVSADDTSGCLEEPRVEPYAPVQSDECDPNYGGQCLDPNSYDYDCEGGSGDGPDYTGYVEVIGDDVYDLDRDGDGIACDW